MTLSEKLRQALPTFKGIALIGPRTDTKTHELAIPTPMGPDLPNTDATVVLTESIPPDDKIKLQGGGRFKHWFEHLEGTAPVHLSTNSGQPAIMGGDYIRYLAGWPDKATFDSIIGGLCDVLDLPSRQLPDGLRIRDTDTHRFIFNYAPKAQTWNGTIIPAAGVYWEALT